MKQLWIEIQDSMTCIPALAIQLQGGDNLIDRCFLSRSGYRVPGDAIALLKTQTGECGYTDHDWPSDTRTMRTAHKYIRENFSRLQNGQVVDVRVILGEAEDPGRPEIMGGMER